MFLKQIKLSNVSKDRLSRLKGKTGIAKEKWKDDENVLANVKYLPHTGVLMSYKTYREKSR